MPYNEKILIKFREFMKNENIDFFIINATDEYLNEYIDLNINSRYLLTGFSGSTGDALISQDNVYLFVDGRYHLQADAETDKNIINVVKLDLKTSPLEEMIDKLNGSSFEFATIGVISTKINYSNFNTIKQNIKFENVIFKEYNFDPVLEQAENLKTDSSVHAVSVEIAGTLPCEKLQNVRTELKKDEIDVLVVTKLEEIAYLTNLRGDEIAYSSSYKAKALILGEECIIFCNTKKIPEQIKQNLADCIKFTEENAFEKIFTDLSQTHNFKKIGIDKFSTNLNTYRIIEKLNGELVEYTITPISQIKAVKNPSELNHMQECFRKTDIVVSRAISWLNQKLQHGEKVSEKEFSNRVKELFFEDSATALSFEVISASGKNTAVIHYTHPDSEKYIKMGELVLLDCGAYYEGGYATDITRTFLAGGSKAIASSTAKNIYTIVLKGFLNALNLPANTNLSGFDIDKTARDIINSNSPEGFNFAHSTGHGVGIAVHEAPPRISPAESSKHPLIAGMCFTIEPGIYNNNWGGVRIENTVILEKQDDLFKIKSLARAGFDKNLIDYSLLNNNEKIWLEEYNRKTIG